MTRTWMLFAAAVAAAGCKSPPPSIDPFFGRATVPPPVLGAAAPPPADSAYYSGDAPTAAADSSGRAAGTAAQPVARRQQSADVPERVEPTPRPATRSLRSASPDEAPPRRSTQQSTEAPERFAARGPLRAIDESSGDDAPLAQRERTGGRTSDEGVRQAGFVELPARGTADAGRGGAGRYAAGSLRYDRDPDYRWLSGRLEYSPTADQWKLRYIPIDGATDDFGGSVILADDALLDDFRDGSHVTVHGQVEGRNADARVFAPYYRVESIEAAE